MRRRLAVAGIVAVAPLVAQAAPPLQVTVDGVPTSVWLQQPFEVVVRVAYDAAWFAASSVPLGTKRRLTPGASAPRRWSTASPRMVST